jgi:dsRNA-specific ribonuclease
LRSALTHGSVQRNDIGLEEFFGYYVLSTTISQMAYEKFRNKLTSDLLERIHKSLCNNYILCQFAKKLELQDLVQAEKRFLDEKEVANIFVSLLAAIFMDSGMEAAVDFIRKLIGPTLNNLADNGTFAGIQIDDTIDINEQIPKKCDIWRKKS